MRRQIDQQTREGKGPQACGAVECQTLVIQIDDFNIRERGGRARQLRARGEEQAHWHWVYLATVFRLEDRVAGLAERVRLRRKSYLNRLIHQTMVLAIAQVVEPASVRKNGVMKGERTGHVPED